MGVCHLQRAIQNILRNLGKVNLIVKIINLLFRSSDLPVFYSSPGAKAPSNEMRS